MAKKNTNNFIVEIVEHDDEYARGYDGMATTIVGVAATLVEGMELLRALGAKEGRVLQVFPPRVREDGKVVPYMPDIFPFKAAKPARKK